MARVNVDQSALVDPRYQKLGRLLKVDRFFALGVMIYIWNQCQEQETYTLTEEEIKDIIPEKKNIVEAIISAKLAEKTSDGLIRIKGTEGRIEWLKKKRENARFGVMGKKFGPLGGRPPKNPHNEPPEKPPEGVPNNPLNDEHKNPPPAPAPAPAPAEKPPYPPSSRGASSLPYRMSKKEQDSFIHSQIGSNQTATPSICHPCDSCNKPFLYAKPLNLSEDDYCFSHCPSGFPKGKKDTSPTNQPDHPLPPEQKKKKIEKIKEKRGEAP